MLTPHANDPKREEELARRELDPVSFGASDDNAIQKSAATKDAQAKAQAQEKPKAQ